MENSLKLAEIFTPTARKRRQELDDSGTLLAHYTTAENAFKILESQSLWMRNALNMEDYREIDHGHELLVNYFQDPSKKGRILSVLGKCCGEAGKTAVDQFDKNFPEIRRSTYISCFSAHESRPYEHGRLSMWRAFGKGRTGVALVFRPPKRDAAAPLRVILVPVMYFTPELLWDELDIIFNNIEANEALLKTLPPKEIYSWVFVMLLAMVTSLKHPGFEEEQEWRLIHLPKTIPSEYMPESTEVIGGVPQLAHKVSLTNNPEAEIAGIALPELLDRVIVGPTQHGHSISASLSKKLTEIGVQNPSNRIFLSGIPLRT